MLAFSNIGAAQNSTLKDSITTCFKEIKEATTLHKKLWNRDIYGPFLFINPQTREVYANVADSAGSLKRCGDIFCGSLPSGKIISNTSTKWNGTQWATAILPLEKTKAERLNLCTHELFHVSQPALGFHTRMGNNGHLDTKNGRLYLRLELAALEKALQATKRGEAELHIYNALLFRQYRYLLFANAKEEENKNELNEGIANYSGIYMSVTSDEERRAEYIRNLKNGVSYKTYVMGYAYLAIPCYGYLLSKRDKGWNRKIDSNTNLTDFFCKEYRFKSPEAYDEAVKRAASAYEGEKLAAEEEERERKQQETLDAYTDLLVSKPHLFLNSIKMNIGFNPQEAISFGEYGTIYPTLTVTDKWGKLAVSKGGLLEKNWKGVTVSAITKEDGAAVEGDGWVLNLNSGFVVVKGDDGNWRIEGK
jgi:hypothetical protein